MIDWNNTPTGKEFIVISDDHGQRRGYFQHIDKFGVVNVDRTIQGASMRIVNVIVLM